MGHFYCVTHAAVRALWHSGNCQTDNCREYRNARCPVSSSLLTSGNLHWRPRYALAIAAKRLRRRSAKSQSHGKVPLRATNALFGPFSAFSVSFAGWVPQLALSQVGNCRGVPRGYMPAYSRR